MARSLESLHGGNGQPKELPNHGVEIRFAEIEKDAAAIAKIFSEPGVIEHLAGVAPAMTKRNIREFRKKIQQYMPDITLTNIPILIATADELKSSYSNPNSRELLVAVRDGEIVGTITIEKGGEGMLWGQVSRTAVSESEKGQGRIRKGQGTGTRLLQAANNRMFNELGYRGASAGIIRGVKDDHIPLHTFENAGYRLAGSQSDICLGWSVAEDMFVYRNSVRVTREIPREVLPKVA